MRIRSVIALAILLTAVCTLTAEGQEPDTRPGVAVLPFDVAQLPPVDLTGTGLNFGLQQMLLSELEANAAIRIVDRRALNDVMRELDLTASGNVDGETAAELGRFVGARYMIGASYVDNFGDVRLDARIISVETTEVIATARVTDSIEKLFDLMGDLAQKVTVGVDLPPLPVEAREARLSQEPPMEAFILFSHALGQDEGGDQVAALQTLEQLIAEFPDYTEPAAERSRILGS